MLRIVQTRSARRMRFFAMTSMSASRYREKHERLDNRRTIKTEAKGCTTARVSVHAAKSRSASRADVCDWFLRGSRSRSSPQYPEHRVAFITEQLSHLLLLEHHLGVHKVQLQSSSKSNLWNKHLHPRCQVLMSAYGSELSLHLESPEESVKVVTLRASTYTLPSWSLYWNVNNCRFHMSSPGTWQMLRL